MLLPRNTNCVSIVKLNFYFYFSMFFFIIIVKRVTYVMTTKNAKKKLSAPIPRHKLCLSHVNVFYAIMEDN